ncbi:hypothetical protein AVEN_157091-1 [Araneus ventricosus]|uniref:Uncharacterized protein n=1 Tax=Araneus ventricosus TaxID=182803 RepID=A0A4Y2FUB9_ARAVE|nr:hypothetical protein AVEN_157091-1 [Araneus ventricosus]
MFSFYLFSQLQERGAFVICDGNAEVVVDHTTMFEGNGFLSALFCLCSSYVYFKTPKPKKYRKTYTVLEKLTFAEKLPSRSEEASFIKSILDSFDEPKNPVLVSSDSKYSDTWVLRI